MPNRATLISVSEAVLKAAILPCLLAAVATQALGAKTTILFGNPADILVPLALSAAFFQRIYRNGNLVAAFPKLTSFFYLAFGFLVIGVLSKRDCTGNYSIFGQAYLALPFYFVFRTNAAQSKADIWERWLFFLFIMAVPFGGALAEWLWVPLVRPMGLLICGGLLRFLSLGSTCGLSEAALSFAHFFSMRLKPEDLGLSFVFLFTSFYLLALTRKNRKCSRFRTIAQWAGGLSVGYFLLVFEIFLLFIFADILSARFGRESILSFWHLTTSFAVGWCLQFLQLLFFYRRIFLLILILVLPTSGFAKSIPRVYLQNYQSEEVLSAPDNKIVYGNEHYGYFEKETSNGHLEFFPPGYRYPIKFFILNPNQPTCYKSLGERRFGSPENQALNLALPKKPFSFQYILMLDSISHGEGESEVTIAYLLNRFGERVWAYAPSAEKINSVNFVMGKTNGTGKYYFVSNVFEEVNALGEVERSLKLTSEGADYPIHFDFLVTGGRSLTGITFAPKLHFDLATPWPYFYFSASDDLRSWNLETGKSTVRWKTEEWFKKRHFVRDSLNIFHSFSHPNSIFHDPGEGYLLSQREDSSLVFIDDKTGRLRYSIGNHPEDTFRTSGHAEFFFQHSASLIGANRILLLDNGKVRSRVIILKLDSATGTAQLEREFVPPVPLRSVMKGSAIYSSDSKSVLGYFPSSSDSGKLDHLVEFDERTGKVLVHSVLEHRAKSETWGRVSTSSSIAGEKFLGYKLTCGSKGSRSGNPR